MMSIEQIVKQMSNRYIERSVFPDTLDGFQLYLTSNGARFWSAKEISRPAYPQFINVAEITEAGKRADPYLLMPPTRWQVRSLAVTLVMDPIRAYLGEPVKSKHWWRPSSYNRAAKGAVASDHLEAWAADFVFASQASMLSALVLLAQVHRLNRDWGLRLGIGYQTIHVSVGRPGKLAPAWVYNTAPRTDVSAIFPEAIEGAAD